MLSGRRIAAESSARLEGLSRDPREPPVRVHSNSPSCIDPLLHTAAVGRVFRSRRMFRIVCAPRTTAGPNPDTLSSHDRAAKVQR